MATKKLTQKQKLLKRLASGTNMFVTEATNRLRISNLSARIAELRNDDGYEIYTNTVKGRTAYRLNTKRTPVARGTF